MYADFFAKSPMLVLPLVALAIFVSVFATALVQTFTRKGRADAREAELLPLGDDAAALRAPAHRPHPRRPS